MTINRMVELLAFEHACMLRNSHGDCDRHCEDCNLVQDDGELHEMYTSVISLLKAQEPQATTHEAEWHIFKERRGATCSYCKRTFDDVYDAENYDYYCRHCGAKMVKIRTVKWDV